MSSGSYFTIYRKLKNKTATAVELDRLKNEYFLSNKNSTFSQNASDEDMKKDIPLLLDAAFKASSIDDSESSTYYGSEDGALHEKLLEFSFGSSFTGLKEKFGLNPYSYSKSSVLVPKPEAEKILQAVKYILSKRYCRELEDILSNEYVDLLGKDYSPYIDRFTAKKHPIYIDKESTGYVIRHGDDLAIDETTECDDAAVYALKKVRACIEAFLSADTSFWKGEDLVLQYSAY